MPLPMVPAPMTTTALSLDSAVAFSTIDGLRALERGTTCNVRMPFGQARRNAPPAQRVEPVVQVAERAADGHVADRERRFGQRLGLVVEQRERRPRLELEGLDQRLQRNLPLALVAPEDERIQQAVAERVPAQRLPPVRAL